jgi:hypothetical protein
MAIIEVLPVVMMLVSAQLLDIVDEVIKQFKGKAGLDD